MKKVCSVDKSLPIWSSLSSEKIVLVNILLLDPSFRISQPPPSDPANKSFPD